MASINLQGDTSGSISISAPSIAGSNTLTLPATTQTLATQNALGVRNLIINGDMRIAQRATSVSGLTGSAYNTIDRMYTVILNGGTWTQSQDTDVPSGQGFATSLKMQCTTADASLATVERVRIEQHIEAQMLQHIANGTANAKSLTVSFWVKSNKTGTYNVSFYKYDNTVRTVGKTYTIDTADTWEKKTITFDGDTSGGGIDNNNDKGLTLYFWLAAGPDYTSGTFNNGTWENYVTGNWVSSSQVNLADSTSNYINITGVQLEVGDTATPFEHRPYDMELSRCKRYYEKSYPIGTFAGSTVVAGRRQMGGSNASATTSFLSGPIITFEVEKRTTPTIVLYDSAGNSGKCVRYQLGLGDSQNQAIVTADIGSTGLYTYSATGDSRTGVGVHFTADAEL